MMLQWIEAETGPMMFRHMYCGIPAVETVCTVCKKVCTDTQLLMTPKWPLIITLCAQLIHIGIVTLCDIYTGSMTLGSFPPIIISNTAIGAE